MTNSKRNRIAPISIFFMLYIYRIVVSLTNVQSVTTGIVRSDMLVSIALSLLFTLLFSLPALICYQKNKSPFDVKLASWFYYIYFTILAGVNISRFSSFASSVVNPEATATIFSVLIVIAVCYCAVLGIEGIARFSSLAFILIVIAILSVLVFNLGNYNEVNLYPVINDSGMSIVKNTAYMTTSSNQILVLLCLNKRINGDATKPFVASVITSFFTIFMLVLFVNATMGDAASSRAYPVYALFQLAKLGVFERLDILHISFWIVGIFVKAVLLVYCSSISLKNGKNSTKCILSAVLVLAVSILMNGMISFSKASHIVLFVMYIIGCLIIPLLCLCFKKRNLGDELIESF